MNSRIGLLAALLVIQLVLVGVAIFAGGGNDGATPLLELESKAVTGVTISASDEDSVVLTRTADGWRVGELPADADKITDVIDKLSGGTASWPVATSEDSQERFEVTEEKHQRRVDFQDGDDVLATVYLGTSPGYRRVHARRDGEDAIYSIDFAVHELPTSVDDWLDKRLFASDSIRRIELPEGHVLEQAGDDAGWTLDGAATDPEAVKRYLERFERLSVLGLYNPDDGVSKHDGAVQNEGASQDEGASPDEAAALGEASIVRVDTADGSRQLTFRFNESGDEYVLTGDRYPGEFRVASYVAEQILGDPSDLLPKPEAADAAAAEPAGETVPEAEAPGAG